MADETSVFELPSSKNYSIEKAVALFVPTPLFWECLHSDSHDIILGTRGSGKTILLRMMSAPHLSRLARTNATARAALSQRRRFGIFLPLGIDWCVAYQEPIAGSYKLFQNGVNLVAADAFAEALDSLLREGVIGGDTPEQLERALVHELVGLWFRSRPTNVHSLLSLRLLLARQQSALRDLWRGQQAPAPSDEERAEYIFREAPLFMPLDQAARVANALLRLNADHRWLLCLDELEDLKPEQKKAIRTALRGSLRSLALKITAQPYTGTGAGTAFSEDATSVDFRDYELKRLQYDPRAPDYRSLVLAILCKRLGREPSEEAAFRLFGHATFAQLAERIDPEFPAFRARLGWADNTDGARKKVPVVAIRRLKRDAEGHRRSVAYSGWDTIVNVSDGNPGVFVRMLNELQIGAHSEQITPETQHATLVRLAASWHEWSRALYAHGRLLHGIIGSLGRSLSARLHSRRVADEDVDQETNQLQLNLESLNSELAEAFRVGARHALFVAQELGAPLRYPEGEGVWRLAFFLAPRFWLLPRKGRSARVVEGQLQFGFAKDASTVAVEPGDPRGDAEAEPV